MCVDLQLSERHRQKRDRRWRFHRLRDSSRKLDGAVIHPAAHRHAKRLDRRPIIEAVRPEPRAYVASPDLISDAIASQRLQDRKDARRFAEEYPYAGASAA